MDDDDGEDEEGYTDLHRASYAGNLEIVKKLLCNRIDVNKQTKYGWTALHMASSKGDLEIVKKLLCAGADANVRNTQNDEKAIDVVPKNEENTELVELLQRKGRVEDRTNLKVVQTAVINDCTTMSNSGKQVFGWCPGEGPQIGNFVGGKITRKSKKSKRKTRKNKRKTRKNKRKTRKNKRKTRK